MSSNKVFDSWVFIFINKNCKNIVWLKEKTTNLIRLIGNLIEREKKSV